MLSRWDMADAVPDIMITNYSMLNVLLLRDRDRQYFDSTRDWLRANPEHRFTLVVDELHTYRGTAGTEVALLIRNLKMRLGLDDRSDQLQIIAASASLEADRDEAYVEQFFAVPRETFDFLPGQIVRPEVAESDLSGTSFASESGTPTKEDEEVAATALGNAFFLGADGTAALKPQAKSVKELSTHLFPELPGEARIEAVHRVLKTAAESEAGEAKWPMLRSHLFFRNVPGMWACTDAGCPEADTAASPTRPIGRLYAEPEADAYAVRASSNFSIARTAAMCSSAVTYRQALRRNRDNRAPFWRTCPTSNTCPTKRISNVRQTTTFCTGHKSVDLIWMPWSGVKIAAK